jgi:hypothetical protein
MREAYCERPQCRLFPYRRNQRKSFPILSWDSIAVVGTSKRVLQMTIYKVVSNVTHVVTDGCAEMYSTPVP